MTFSMSSIVVVAFLAGTSLASQDLPDLSIQYGDEKSEPIKYSVDERYGSCTCGCDVRGPKRNYAATHQSDHDGGEYNPDTWSCTASLPLRVRYIEKEQLLALYYAPYNTYDADHLWVRISSVDNVRKEDVANMEIVSFAAKPFRVNATTDNISITDVEFTFEGGNPREWKWNGTDNEGAPNHISLTGSGYILSTTDVPQGILKVPAGATEIQITYKPLPVSGRRRLAIETLAEKIEKAERQAKLSQL